MAGLLETTTYLKDNNPASSRKDEAMELTEENQDEMDCRPLGRKTGVRPHPELEAAVAAH